MIKILQARYIKNAVIHLEFSDGSRGDYDFSGILARDTVLTRPLRASEEYFRRFYIELGALGWPNGLEFSAGSLRTELKKEGRLIERKAA